ncbi:MAG: hypothetical protein JXQ84_09830, partial [Rhodospirillaceae bacterium]|nr:hypothetical protein [Rhodospirillaceae bacterium]
NRTLGKECITMKAIERRVADLEHQTAPAYGVTVMANNDMPDEAIAALLAAAGLKPTLTIRLANFGEPCEPHIIGKWPM